MNLLQKTVDSIGALDQDAIALAQSRLNILTKPQGSLGKLEDICLKIAGITGKPLPSIEKARHIMFAADHGVVEEGVSAFPQSVTISMVHNFLNGGAAVNVFAKLAEADIKLVDIGIKGELNLPGLISKKIKSATDNFCQGPAMTKDEAIAALEVGIAMAEEAKKEGCDLLTTGEMGIGNTTPSSALTAFLTGTPPEEVVGRGTGIDDQGLQIKIQAIKKAIALNNPDKNDPLDVLAKIGGLEIAGMAGLILGAAAMRIPVIIDGFISGAAALVALGLNPACTNFMLASHASLEPGHAHILKALELEASIFLDMRLGEGTGAVLMIHLVRAALAMIKGMATFGDIGM